MRSFINRFYRKKNFAYCVANGYTKMSQSRVVICCMVRNCAPALKRNIPQIEKLRSLFLESRVVVIENDSKDDTKSILQNWADTHEGIVVKSKDFHSETIPRKTGNVLPAFSFHRISRMSSYRNLYMEELERLDFDADYVIVVDPDVHSFSVEGIANTFGQPVSWDMVSSNGKGVHHAFRGLYRYYVYYDAYALQKTNDIRSQTPELILQHQHVFAGLEKGDPMIGVFSGFNGLGIYRMEAIKGLRYIPEENHDENVEVWCEHVSLHKQMAERGFHRIYINPSQIVIYETVWQNYLRSFRRIVKRIFPIDLVVKNNLKLRLANIQEGFE